MPIELNPKSKSYKPRDAYAIGEHAASGVNGCGYGYSNANGGIGATSRAPSLYQYQAAQANYAVCSPCSATEEDDTVMPSQTTSSGNVAAAAATVSPGADMNIPKKPMRPLTAYHIYFQIEREYIIQSMDGDDTEKSMNDNKIYLDYVPERYRNIKLSPQWYFGPGKRQKRKHRKQHGKIGFLELSRMISERWAKLEESDPEVKKFVHKVAKQELEEYQREMKTYKDLIKRRAAAACSSTSKKRKQPEMQQEMYSMPTSQMDMACYPTNSHQQRLMNKSMQLRHEIDQLKYEIAQREIAQLKTEMAYVNSCVAQYKQHFNDHPMPTQPSTSEPPKKKFYRRQISNQPVSANEVFTNPEMSGNSEPALSRQANFGKFYRRQSSNLSLSFLDPVADELKRSETFPPANPTLPNLK